MAPLRSYRPVALLAVLALLLSAFAPASTPCAESPAPPPMPCHEGMAMDRGAPPAEAPAPVVPRAAMPCCIVTATTTPAAHAETTLALVATVVMAAPRVPPAPARSVAPTASPPRGQPLPFSVLYGCFLT